MSDATHMKVVEAVQDVIQALKLAGYVDRQVYLRRVPTDRNVSLPAVLVSPGPEPEDLPDEGLNKSDYTGYPVLISVVSAGNQDLTVSDKELYWRERIRKAFRFKEPSTVLTGLPTGTVIHKILVRPGPILDLNLWQQNNLCVSTLTLMVYVREARV